MTILNHSVSTWLAGTQPFHTLFIQQSSGAEVDKLNIVTEFPCLLAPHFTKKTNARIERADPRFCHLPPLPLTICATPHPSWTQFLKKNTVRGGGIRDPFFKHAENPD